MSTQVLSRLRKPKNSASASEPSQDCFRVAVFGQTGVGKTALSVRFVTRRFIGEYDSSTESIYQRIHVVPPFYPVFFEIMDTPGQQENSSILKEKIKWADAFILVYAINDQLSFTEIIRLKFLISYILTGSSNKSKNGMLPPIIMVGNKCDLEVERMVTTAEGKKTADNLQCSFFETTARNHLDEVIDIFESIYRQARNLECSISCKATKHKGGCDGHVAVMQRPPRQRHRSYKHINKIQRIKSGISQNSPTSKTGDVFSSEKLVSAQPLRKVKHDDVRSYSDSESIIRCSKRLEKVFSDSEDGTL